MRDYDNEENFSYEGDDIPQDEEYVPKKKLVIGRQLLIIIQLIVCALALLFMVIIKLIGGDFCGGIISWYETNYYDSIYPGDGGGLSIFGSGEDSSQNNESKSESKPESRTESKEASSEKSQSAPDKSDTE